MTVILKHMFTRAELQVSLLTFISSNINVDISSNTEFLLPRTVIHLQKNIYIR
jgi:hypothetical protein